MASRELLTSRASDNPERSVVVIDEVQRVPELLSVVHLLIENTTRVRPEDLRGLDSFGAGYPQAALLLLYRGTSRERRGRIWVVPVEDFLKDLAGASVAMYSLRQQQDVAHAMSPCYYPSRLMMESRFQNRAELRGTRRRVPSPIYPGSGGCLRLCGG